MMASGRWKDKTCGMRIWHVGNLGKICKRYYQQYHQVPHGGSHPFMPACASSTQPVSSLAFSPCLPLGKLGCVIICIKYTACVIIGILFALTDFGGMPT